MTSAEHHDDVGPPAASGPDVPSDVVRWGMGDAALVLPFAVLASFVLFPFVNDAETPTTTADAASYTAFAAITFGGPVVWASYRKGRRDLGADFGWYRPTRVDLGVGLGVGLVLMASTVAMSAALEALVGPVPSNNTLETDPPVGALATAVEVLAVVVGAPVVEELYFRGLVLRAAIRRFGPVIAVVGTALAFSFMHGLDLGQNGWTLPVAMLPGDVVLTWLAWRRGGLAACVIAHATFNGIAVVASLTG